MTLLVIGVVLWIAAHFFKRIMPEARAKMGEKGRSVIMVVLVISIVMMVVGYRSSDHIQIYNTPSWGIHINNLLMVIAVILMGLSNSTSRFRGLMRHPMLAGVGTFSIAHLLVNGDLASVILFGGLFVWALLQGLLINLAEPDWTKPEPGDLKGDIKLLVISAVILLVASFIHNWLGYPVFPG